ncbi:alpha/beta hydrolase-fold protein [Brevibacillus nitrificans]|uniref:alpha/beta hydrolase n=1 Tax=Brevibacillus nitrificans TaxID=651560 RepID=UPI00285A2025|nr:alpha/beta hydrolase-fold protein [Brevibacillus nitrificans]MDR7315494.1 putative alpha/beta superfamily hydrolase [Brevibacillus nitrificans]
MDVPVTIPRTHKKVAHSRNREYHLFVSIPAEAPPPEGFPVIYLLDANSVFGTMTEAVRAQSRFPERTGVYPAVIVGIGYPTEMPFHIQRHYDFTSPVPLSELPASPDGSEWPEQGGAAYFLDFLEDEVKPMIEKEFPVDPKQQTIFGHSLGGLFVLYALFSRPYSFQNYIAGSPSIHWNERVLLERERAFTGMLEEKKTIRLFIGLGELEASHPSQLSKKASEMYERLSLLKDQNVLVTYREFPDESHISVLPVLISQSIRFASKKIGQPQQSV